MSYNTRFRGSFKLSKPLTADQALYLRTFNKVIHVRRDPKICEQYDDSIREAVGLPIGKDGEYTVFGLGYRGKEPDESVIDNHLYKTNIPSEWCPWTVSNDNTHLIWDGEMSAYNYTSWLIFLHELVLARWKITLHGTVYFKGEDLEDRGRIKIKKGMLNVVKNGNKINEDSIIHLTTLKCNKMLTP